MGQDFPLLQVPAWIDLLAIGVGALAGAAGAVRLRFDLIGVLFVAILMGLGGGIIRDVLLGLRPVAVTDQNYLLTAVGAGLAALVVLRLVNRWTQLFLVFDALSLALFTIVGVEKAALYGIPGAGAIFIGVVSGVGGGVIRDLVADQPVEIVRRGTWNAAAALVGAAGYVVLRDVHAPVLVAEITAFVIIVAARYSALHWGWQTAEAADLLARVTHLPRPAWGGGRRPGPRRRAGAQEGHRAAPEEEAGAGEP
jgi:uncharacterized membrane protein YeiH